VRHGSESSEGGSSTQTVEDTAGSKQIKIPPDKTFVLVQRDGTARLSAEASLSPRLFRLSMPPSCEYTVPPGIVPNVASTDRTAQKASGDPQKYPRLMLRLASLTQCFPKSAFERPSAKSRQLQAGLYFLQFGSPCSSTLFRNPRSIFISPKSGSTRSHDRVNPRTHHLGLFPRHGP
jgi:hypothetical protein